MTKPAPDSVPTVAILGVGLLGGSVAAALKRLPTSTHIVGWARSVESKADLLAFPFLDEVQTSLRRVCESADVIVVASPVDTIAELVILAAQHCPPDCLITDVGSTKATITHSVDRSVASGLFVAAHPIAGGERSGAAAAKSNLFDGKLTILTPGSGVDSDRIERCDRFWRSTGCSTITMSAEQHDRSLAAVSHVPHLIAAVVAKASPAESLDLVGSGWRDVTRVAAGDASMWTAIVRENRQAIGQHLKTVSGEIAELQQFIDRSDDESLMRWLSSAAKIRQRVSDISVTQD